jgi:hypothetical protein
MDMRIGSCEPGTCQVVLSTMIYYEHPDSMKICRGDQSCEHLLICLGVNGAFQFVPTIDELVVARGNRLRESSANVLL